MNKKIKKCGKAYLVGAGPGDIGLMTVKGVKCLKRADVVIYDYHLNAEVLNYANRNAEFIYAGKRGGYHEMSQDEITSAIVEKAREGKIVCRLKGGDPFVFGRGGEEAEALAEAGIAFEVVPGVSSSVAAAAYAGIPLTHRKYSSSFAVITGSEASTKSDSTVDWDKMSTGIDTLVFLMAMNNIEAVAEKLVAHGRPAETPVAVVRWGTRPDQSTVVGTLQTITGLVAAKGIKSPAIVIVGNVVRLRDKLRWYEDMPMFGHRLLLCCARKSEFELIEELGAEVFVVNCGPGGCRLPKGAADRTRPMRHPHHAKRMLRFLRQGRITLAVFTSAEEVANFFEIAGADAAAYLNDVAIAVLNTETANALEAQGFSALIVPKTADLESLVAAIVNWAAADVKCAGSQG